MQCCGDSGCGECRRDVEVDAVEFDGVGAFLHLGVDGSDVLADDAEEEQLDGRDED